MSTGILERPRERVVETREKKVETINAKWVERCAYRFSEIREEFGGVADPKKDWLWAQELAEKHLELSHKPDWQGKIADDIVDKEFIHRVYLGQVRMN